MRKVTTAKGEILVRPLSWGEIRAMREADQFSIERFARGEGGAEAIQLVFDAVFDADQLAVIDQLPFPEVVKVVWPAVLAETWGDAGEEKNLPPSGPGAQTDAASTTAKTADQPSASKE